MNAILLTTFWGIVFMMFSFLIKNKTVIKTWAILAILSILVANLAELGGHSLMELRNDSMLAFTNYGLWFNAICFFATLAYFSMSSDQILKISKTPGDFYALLFFILCGVSIVTAYSSLLMLFIGIEIISIPSYILAGSNKSNLKSNEAALKYFLMSSFSTGILLMGIALLYGATGSFSAEKLKIVNTISLTYMDALGLLLVFIALCFKASVAPFHFWTPDAYDGTPTAFTSFFATIIKVSIFAAFYKLLEHRFGLMGFETKPLIAICIVLTWLVGNLTAIFQQSVKRMLAYSSIAQAGFMLLAIFALNSVAKEGLLYYALAYCLATMGIFAVVDKMSDYTISGFNGLAKTHPVLAFSSTVFLLSLTGIPLTAGFFAKYFMLSAVVSTGGYFWIVVLGVLFAAMSSVYYFRIIQAMYFKDASLNNPIEDTLGMKITLIVVAVLIVLLGVYPDVLNNLMYGLL